MPSPWVWLSRMWPLLRWIQMMRITPPGSPPIGPDVPLAGTPSSARRQLTSPDFCGGLAIR